MLCIEPMNLRDGNHCENITIGISRFGRGLFAARDFERGESLMVFEGAIITFKQTLQKGAADECYPLQVDEDRYIDLVSPGRFINHSCNPNSGIVRGRLLHSLRLIREGEEICFDYSTAMLERHWTMTCGCGAPSCRGLIADFDLIPHETQTRHLDLGIVQPFIARRALDSIPSVAALRPCQQPRILVTPEYSGSVA